MKDSINMMKRQVTDWKKTFEHHIAQWLKKKKNSKKQTIQLEHKESEETFH